MSFVLTNSVGFPCFYYGYASNWESCKFWSPDFFKERYGDNVVESIQDLPTKSGSVPYYLSSYKKHQHTVTLKDFITTIKNGSCYLPFKDLKDFKDLNSHVHFDEIIKNLPGKTSHIALWIGNKTNSGLHYDMFDNVFVQVYGKKNYILVSPDETAKVYPIPGFFPMSRIEDPLSPDLKKYPRFKKARKIQGVLNPGDMIFIPKGWYHSFSSPNVSISLSCWFGSPLEAKKLILSFFRSGFMSWVALIRDFFWYGVLSKPVDKKIFCPEPYGKQLYQYLFRYKKKK